MKRQRGSALVAILPLTVIASAFVALTVTASQARLHEQDYSQRYRRALNNASGVLARAQSRIKDSAYVSGVNQVMDEALANGEDSGLVNGQGDTIRLLYRDPKADVWISMMEPGWFQLDCVASVGGIRAQVRALVRERDSFSRFGAFVNSQPLGVGRDPRGDIHTNRVLQLFYADGTYEDPVTARDGFEWLVGATEENTTFKSTVDEGYGEIPMPNAAAIDSRGGLGDGALDALLGGADADDFDIEVTFKGKTYDLVAKPKAGGTALSAPDLAFPASGVVFIDGDVSSVSGELDARVTLAVTGSVTITDSIRYVDADGDSIYNNGLSEDPANEPYEPNSDYDGDAVLGLMATESILYHDDVPDTLEVNGYFFSAEGAYGLPGLQLTSDGRYVKKYDKSFQKKSYRRLGGIATDKRIVSTVVNSKGDVLSGFVHGKSIYDRRLQNAPPPNFLSIDRPVFSAYRVVGGRGGSGEQLGAQAPPPPEDG